MRRALRISALAALVALSGCVWRRGPAKGPGVSGAWHIAWGDGSEGTMDLQQSGDRVDGKIIPGSGDEGSVRGLLEGNTLRFVAMSKDGSLVNYGATLSEDGKKLLYGSTVGPRGASTWGAVR